MFFFRSKSKRFFLFVFLIPKLLVIILIFVRFEKRRDYYNLIEGRERDSEKKGHMIITKQVLWGRHVEIFTTTITQGEVTVHLVKTVSIGAFFFSFFFKETDF